MRVESGNFVSVIGSVDLGTGEATIDYVNPTKRRIVAEAGEQAAATAGAVPGRQRPVIELVIEGEKGEELARVAPLVREPSSPDSRGRVIGLIQENVPRLPGMRTLRLCVDGKTRAKFTAASEPDQAGGPVPLNLMGPPDPASRNRRGMSGQQPTAEAPGVTYTVQVKPDDAAFWSTIAVGRPTPDFELDRNQFPGAR